MLKVGTVIISVTKAQADRHKARRARGARVHHCMYTSMYYQTVYQKPPKRSFRNQTARDAPRDGNSEEGEGAIEGVDV